MKRKSWKTSLGGIILICLAVSSFLWSYFDGDPTTVPNGELFFAQLAGGIALIFARDNNKSSEAVGAK